jgi:hypothetical protein
MRFGGKNAINNFGGLGEGKNKSEGNRLVASPFGLCSGLRQSGGRCAAGLRRGAEAPLYLRSKSNGKDNATTATATANGNGNSNRKLQRQQQTASATANCIGNSKLHRQQQTANSNGNSNVEMRGSLRCSTDDETVCCFGRNEDI